MILSKKQRNGTWNEGDAENSSEYYYDDSTGYRTYQPENEDEDLEDEREEDEE